MAIDASVPWSRRSLLAGGLAGAAALGAATLGRPPVARGGDGDALLLGRTDNAATGATWVTSSTDVGLVGKSFGDAAGAGLAGWAAASTGLAFGVTGTTDAPEGAGLYGVANHASGPVMGVDGRSDSPAGMGVRGVAAAATGSAVGVHGESDSATGAGVRGHAVADATGVLGFSGSTTLPVAPAKTGVYGRATQDAASRGVYGYSTAGFGVRGYATTGTAGYFATQTAAAGYALRAIGRVKLDKCAGVTTIPAGASSVLVTPGVDLVSTSAVVATLQGKPTFTTAVRSVEVDTTANTFTIHLTAFHTANVKVAWHVFG